MAKKQKSLPLGPTKDDIDDALGLFLMAFGQGVGPQHVRHEVVRAINTRFRASLTAAFSDPAITDWRATWKADAASVLSMMTAVGRMSGLIAMSSKRPRSVVKAKDFNTALEAVKTEHDFEGPRRSLGKYCQ
ncbi:MAG: hypothetical protein JJE39_14390 [Vicinamibacteria bacterium]|nr:hypothetical protein [Vicinamibacteria bacterium]